MATLPDPTQIRRETPRPSTTVASYRGGITESAQAQFGADVAKMAEVEGNRIDNAVVEEAYTELRQRRAELSVGEKGYASKKGSSIVRPPEGEKPFLDDYTERFNSAVGGISSRLSARQREKFDALASRERVAFQTDVLSHSMRETEAYNAKANEGAINFEVQQGPKNWKNPTEMNASLDRINRVYDRMIVGDGLPKDAVDALRNATVSKFHTSVISSIEATKEEEGGGVAAARKYFEENKKQILDVEGTGKKITLAENAKVNMQVGLETAEEGLKDPSSTGNLEAIAQKIRKDPRLQGDPDRIDAAISHARTRINERRDTLTQENTAVDRMFDAGIPFGEIEKTTEWDALPAKVKRIFRSRAAGGSEEPTGERLKTYYALVNDPKRLAGMSADEINEYARPLTKAMRASLFDMNSQLKTKPEKVIEAKVDTEAFNVAYAAKVGKSPHDKEQKESVEKARFYVETRVDMAQQQLKRQLTRAEKQAFIDEALQQVETPGRWYGTNKAPLFAVPVEKIAVPAEQRAIIAERLKKHLPKGVEPSELDIQNLYLKEKQLPIGR